VTAEQLREAFSQFGNIEEVRLMTTDRGLPSGAGFVKFETIDSAISFVESHKADPLFVLDRELHINHARPRPQRAFVDDPTPTHTLTLYGYQGGEAEVREIFQEYEEEIREVRVVNAEDESRRRVFVEFFKIEQATAAREALNAKQDFSRPLIQYAKLRQQRRAEFKSTFATRQSRR
jgi:RNA recognition motif-containing protein